MFETFKKFDPEFPCDFLIVDNSSTDYKHLKVLDKLLDVGRVITAPNERVETSFNYAWNKDKTYKYYMFLHDDIAANRHGWLRVFIERLQSNYVENIISNTHYSEYQIGKVGAITHPWRDYSSVLGFPVQCRFLKDVVELLEGSAPLIFRYSDCDRTLITNECLEATKGIRNMQEFALMEKENSELFDKVCGILNRYLAYPDEGMMMYPAGKSWNKICLLTEFMNSINPIVRGYRTIGLDGDGYLEQVHGYDIPWGHKYLHHYGAPNFCKFIGKILNTDSQEVKKKLKDKIFLIKCDKMIQEYFKNVQNC